MTPEETETIMNKADSCAEGECTIDDVTELIAILKEQQKEIYDRLIDIKASVKSLEAVNESDERKVDEVRETVRSLFRVFQLGAKGSGNDYPALMKPSGWSGEVGDGPKTACKFYSCVCWGVYGIFFSVLFTFDRAPSLKNSFFCSLKDDALPPKPYKAKK